MSPPSHRGPPLCATRRSESFTFHARFTLLGFVWIKQQGPHPHASPLVPPSPCPEAPASHVGEQLRAWEEKAFSLLPWILRHGLAEIRQFLEFREVQWWMPHVSLQPSWVFFLHQYLLLLTLCFHNPHTHLPPSSIEGLRSSLGLVTT